MDRIETHAHSHYSNIRLLDSINRPKDLIKTAYSLGLKGICLTDHEVLSGAVDWLKLEKELKEKEEIPKDFKCGLGNEIYLTDTRDKGQKYYHFILIAKDTIGFRQLCELSSKAWYNSYFDRGMERVPTLKSELKEVVEKNPGHLIATTACIGGELGSSYLRFLESSSKEEKTNCQRQIENFLNFCIDLFGEDFYVEVAPGENEEQINFNKWIKKFIKQTKVKMIYGCDAHYLTKNHRYIHKAYLNSKEGEREVDDFYASAYLMSNDEAYEFFKKADYSEEDFADLCDNSMEIYEKISTYDIFRNPIIPRVEVKNYKKQNLCKEYEVLYSLFTSDDEQERYWVNECWNSLNEKKLVNDKYLSRLNTEADIIKTVGEKLGNCLFEYFNTFQHFIDLFWDCGSLSGPGRGSSVCYLSNYLMGITQLDPLEWNLAEWRFLNKDRLELPDIDTDLSPSKRPLIFKKIREERGELRLLQVATFGTEGTKSAILTACRGYRSEEFPQGIDVDEAQFISSLIPVERGFLWTLKDMCYGDPEKDRKPNRQFIDAVEKYPGLLEIMFSIEGLVNKRSQHASGVILYNEDPWNTGAVMKSPNGDLTTQFSLHEAEALGDTKFDFLVTEICDKITLTINLLKEQNYFNKEDSLRTIYEKYLHPSKIDLNDKRIWDKLASGEVMSLFQFDSMVGAQAIKAIRPTNPIEMMMANALMRLVGEKGKERPLERYVRMKNDMSLWYNECKTCGLTDEEIKILEPYYLSVSGCPTTQEKLMLLCMEPKLGNFSLKDANAARKICAKKQINKIPELKEKFINACPRPQVGEYVWRTAIEPQMSYAFAEPHALAYSYVAIQILVLVVNYPILFWNCACLISDSGGIDDEQDEEEIVSLYEKEDHEEYEYEDLPDRSGKKKKKIKTVEYGKIASAIGKYKSSGIEVYPPDINSSTFTFTPDTENNRIVYGLRGITRLSISTINEIIEKRPYSSFEDFLSKVKINKVQVVNLIKAGTFDKIESDDRYSLLKSYIASTCDFKKRITMQNMGALIEYDLIPMPLEEKKKLYLFNKYLKTCKAGEYYNLSFEAVNFIDKMFGVDDIVNGDMISIKTWDKMYKKEIESLSTYIKLESKNLLEEVNNRILNDEMKKYGEGNISHWEMESVSFYSHPHELYFSNATFPSFKDLPSTPVVKKVKKIKDREINVFDMTEIGGTVIDKDKAHNTVTLLTEDGVVVVKIFKDTFANYDKQISKRNPDGSKTVVEKSWFSRGTLLIINGFRRDDNFVARNKNKYEPAIIKIEKVNDDKTLKLKYEREADE